MIQRVACDMMLDPYYIHDHRNSNPAMVACSFLVAVLVLYCDISDRRAKFILLVLQFIIDRLVTHESENIRPERHLYLPVDCRTLLLQHDLSPRLHSYVCCPNCFAPHRDITSSPCPDHCSFWHPVALERTIVVQCLEFLSHGLTYADFTVFGTTYNSSVMGRIVDGKHSRWSCLPNEIHIKSILNLQK